MPILKPRAEAPGKGRHSRPDLSRAAISAPLGDFRHTMHVGRGGDVFGDTSFLGQGEALAGSEAEGRTEEAVEEEEEVRAASKGEEEEGGGEGPPSLGDGPPSPSALSLFQVDLGPSMLSEVLGVMERGRGTPGTPGADAAQPRGDPPAEGGGCPPEEEGGGEEEQEEEEVNV